jgi:ring-1,2-phenylacetyl-CoA epoxidase subunit PaaD
MNAIEENIHSVLRDEGISNYTIKTVISPPWTTDWMSASAKQKLKE